MTDDTEQTAGLHVDDEFRRFVETELLTGLELSPRGFWDGLASLLERFAGRNADLLERRVDLQAQLDHWHREHRADFAVEAYESFLRDIGYLVPETEPTIDVGGVDPEISSISGPQLVVPVTNARYALNAANARWGSLYDAVYGSDVIAGKDAAAPGYDPARGDEVIRYVEGFLDAVVPLVGAGHGDVSSYLVLGESPHSLAAVLADGRQVGLVDPAGFAGFRPGAGAEPAAVLLVHHGLHIELVIDRAHNVGATHHGGVCDVVLEAAITTIVDLEDSVSTVDAADKTLAYRNWLGLQKGDLVDTFVKNGTEMTRQLAGDRNYVTAQGSQGVLNGRSLLLVRNVGHLLYTGAVRTANGGDIPEGLLDGLVTATAALHDLAGTGGFRNSRARSVYIVKPKMHGPEEVAFTVECFAAIEEVLGLAPNTLKLGIMDEEKRTSLNLGACIEAARERVIFINTGFLDRTGDEIHTCFEAGPVLPKGQMRTSAWLLAYEDRNVDVGIRAGLPGRGQIGKGMWAMPNEMKAMVETKIGHPRAGANCAWVPSPTAATLHAMHYHYVDVAARQRELADRPLAPLADLLRVPVIEGDKPTVEVRRHELDTNAQAVLGYVVRWVQQGIGCSTVPDLANVGLMEDRATLRISSQHIANWLHHGIVDEAEVRATFLRMAAVVDSQNAGDELYEPMVGAFDSSSAYQGALDLVFQGHEAPSGYTEPVLHARRRQAKAR